MEAGQHQAAIPVHKVIASELEIIGSHGMQAHRYPEMLEMVGNGRLAPEKLVGSTISLDAATRFLPEMNDFPSTGVSVIDLSLT